MLPRHISRASDSPRPKSTGSLAHPLTRFKPSPGSTGRPFVTPARQSEKARPSITLNHARWNPPFVAPCSNSSTRRAAHQYPSVPPDRPAATTNTPGPAPASTPIQGSTDISRNSRRPLLQLKHLDGRPVNRPISEECRLLEQRRSAHMLSRFRRGDAEQGADAGRAAAVEDESEKLVVGLGGVLLGEQGSPQRATSALSLPDTSSHNVAALIPPRERKRVSRRALPYTSCSPQARIRCLQIPG
jgi:hypothetical protein